MALIFNHSVAGNSWRRSAYAHAPSLAPKANASPRPAGSFNNNLANSLNRVAELPLSNSSIPATRTQMELPAGFNLKPPSRGLSPAALATGQTNRVNLNPPSSMAYASLTANHGQGLSGQRDGLVQINGSVNRAAARGQFSGVVNKNDSENKIDSAPVRSISSSRSQSRQHYEKLAEQAAERHGVDPNLVKAVITAESDYNPNVVSRAGAMGLMQLMPGTARDMQVKNPFDPKQNIEGGTKYLAWLSQQFDGDERKILAAYNWGPGNVRGGGRMPSETRNYLVKVSRFKQQYQQLAGESGGRLAAAGAGKADEVSGKPDKPAAKAAEDKLAAGDEQLASRTDESKTGATQNGDKFGNRLTANAGGIEITDKWAKGWEPEGSV